VRLLMEHYDTIYFDQLCRRLLRNNAEQLDFRVSSRMTSVGGKTTVHTLDRARDRGRHFPRRHFEITVSATLLFQSRFDPESGPNPICVAGVPCSDRLDAMQRIFEHELIHLIEFLVWNDSSCGRRQFKDIARRLFGHRQSHHQLVTPRESARQDFGIAIGDFVTFNHADNQYAGFVNHINRRATVLVPDKNGQRYTDGKRYVKFYVPLALLRVRK